jgi:hypothetical protein
LVENFFTKLEMKAKIKNINKNRSQQFWENDFSCAPLTWAQEGRREHEW